MRLARVLVGILDPFRSVTPRLREPVRDPRHRLRIVVNRTEVPPGGKARGIVRQSLGEQEVSTQRLEHELPWTDGIGISDQTGLFCEEGSDQIRNQLIARPVTTADGIAGARTTERDPMTVKRSG